MTASDSAGLARFLTLADTAEVLAVLRVLSRTDTPFTFALAGMIAHTVHSLTC